jgi:hypothetical protein
MKRLRRFAAESIGKAVEPRQVVTLAVTFVLAISSVGCPARDVLQDDKTKTLVTDALFDKYGLSREDILGLQFYVNQDVELVNAETGETARQFDASKDKVSLSRTDVEHKVSIKAGTPGIAVAWETMFMAGRSRDEDYLKIDFGNDIVLYFYLDHYSGEYKFEKQWGYAKVKGVWYSREVYAYPDVPFGELGQKVPGGTAYLYCDLTTISTIKTIRSNETAPGKRRKN